VPRCGSSCFIERGTILTIFSGIFAEFWSRKDGPKLLVGTIVGFAHPRSSYSRVLILGTRMEDMVIRINHMVTKIDSRVILDALLIPSSHSSCFRVHSYGHDAAKLQINSYDKAFRLAKL
jgi:hypothetical protein